MARRSASEPKYGPTDRTQSTPGDDFQSMRAKARAGRLTERPKDHFFNDDTTRKSVSGKTRDMSVGLVPNQKAESMRLAKDPRSPQFKTRVPPLR